jgi:putative intracellular protease/amidase
MVLIQFVTVEGCAGAPSCQGCKAAEDLLRSVASLAGLRMPTHEPKIGGEYYLSDGRTIEAVHLDCDTAGKKGLDSKQAPFVYLDGELIATGQNASSNSVAARLLAALRPAGLGDAGKA